jgi:biotin carboxylase
MPTRIALIHPSFDVPFIFEAAKRNNVELVIIQPQAEKIPADLPAIIGSEVLPVYQQPQKALDILLRIQDKWQLDGLMAVKEQAVVWTAEAAHQLGLRGISPDAAIAARDKSLMRKYFQNADLPVPTHMSIKSEDELDKCHSLTYPCIVKPSSGYNSSGVQLVKNAQQLHAAVKHVRQLNQQTYQHHSWHHNGYFDGVLIEEFIDGPEFVVEMFAFNGEVIALNCGYKGKLQGPYFEESIYLCPPLTDGYNIATIQQTAIAGMKALGLTNGPGHCELRLNTQGVPYILEIGARIGGSGCAHFNVEASSGIDFAGLCFKWLSGTLSNTQWPPSTNTQQGAATSWIMPLGGHGKLLALQGIEKAQEHPDCRHILLFGQIGKYYRPYPDFDGFLAIVFGQHINSQHGQAFIDYLDNHVWAKWGSNPQREEIE